MEEAETLFRKAARLYPAYLVARRNLARILQDQGRVEEALAVYREIEAFEPENESLKRKIASLVEIIQQGSTRNLDDILMAMLEALKTDKTNPAIYNNLGNIYAEKGEAKKALEAYHRAIKLDSRYYKVYENLSVFYRNVVQDKKKAEMYLKRYHALKTSFAVSGTSIKL
jgi:tetratricopeptide (TPR) repeat protein